MPSLKDLFELRIRREGSNAAQYPHDYKAIFVCESIPHSASCPEPKYLAAPLTGLSGRAARLSLAHLEKPRPDGRKIIGVYNHPDGIGIAYSRDGLDFHDSGIKIACRGYDPGVWVGNVRGEEQIFVFYEISARPTYPGAYTGVAISRNGGESFCSEEWPLIDYHRLPAKEPRPRGMSTPSAHLAFDKKHLWVWWPHLYGDPTNHAELYRGFIPIVDPDTGEFLRLDEGGVLQRDGNGRLVFQIDEVDKKPILDLGPWHWCKGAVGTGNVVLDGGREFVVFMAGVHAENLHETAPSDEAYNEYHGLKFETEFASAGIARHIGGRQFIVRPHPIAMPIQLGIRSAVEYPYLFGIGDEWFLYFVHESNGDWKRPLPAESGPIMRLKLTAIT